MTNTPLMVESANLRAIATLNGKSRCSVLIYARSDLDTPLLVDEFNLTAHEERTAVVGRLDELLWEEADSTLTQLAAIVAEERTRPRPKAANQEPGQIPPLEPWGYEVDGAALLDTLRAHILRYVVLPPSAAEALSLWVLHTFVTDVTDYTPYILISSPVRECGKTTLDEVLLHLAHRARMTGGITAAALYRTIEKHSPTMILDELDARLRGDAGEYLRGVLNTGFQRSGCITICEGDKNEPRDYKTFCPKVLSGIGRVWDTVTSRSIPIRLSRASREELAKLSKIRGDKIGGISLPYQQQALRWATDNRDQLVECEPLLPEELGARQCDVWRPLTAIAVTCGSHWPDTARKAALALHGVAEEEGDYGLLLLEDLRQIFADGGTTNLHTANILQGLIKREDRPWPEYRAGRAITARGLSDLLGRFGVKSKNVRVGLEVAKGYSLDDLGSLFRTYLRTSDPAVTGVTDLGVTDVTDRTKPPHRPGPLPQMRTSWSARRSGWKVRLRDPLSNPGSRPAGLPVFGSTFPTRRIAGRACGQHSSAKVRHPERCANSPAFPRCCAVNSYRAVGSPWEGLTPWRSSLSGSGTRHRAPRSPRRRWLTPSPR